MIEFLLQMLEITKSKHENIDILKGKYKIPESIKEGLAQNKRYGN